MMEWVEFIEIGRFHHYHNGHHCRPSTNQPQPTHQINRIYTKTLIYFALAFELVNIPRGLVILLRERKNWAREWEREIDRQKKMASTWHQMWTKNIWWCDDDDNIQTHTEKAKELTMFLYLMVRDYKRYYHNHHYYDDGGS